MRSLFAARFALSVTVFAVATDGYAQRKPTPPTPAQKIAKEDKNGTPPKPSTNSAAIVSAASDALKQRPEPGATISHAALPRGN